QVSFSCEGQAVDRTDLLFEIKRELKRRQVPKLHRSIVAGRGQGLAIRGKGYSPAIAQGRRHCSPTAPGGHIVTKHLRPGYEGEPGIVGRKGHRVNLPRADAEVL